MSPSNQGRWSDMVSPTADDIASVERSRYRFLVRFKAFESDLKALADRVGGHVALSELAWERLAHGADAIPAAASLGAQRGVTPTADDDRRAEHLRMRESLDLLDVGLEKGKALVAKINSEFREARAVPQERRTQAFDESVHRYANLIHTHANKLKAHDDAKAELEEKYLKAPSWPVENTNSKASFVANEAMSIVATVAVFLLVPLLFKLVLRDPRHRHHSTKRRRPQPPPPHCAPRQATADEKAKKAKPRKEAVWSKRPPIRSRKKTRRTSVYKTKELDEMKRSKLRWMGRMQRVHMEARGRFKQIRQELDARNLQRLPPKGKKTPSNKDAPRAPICKVPLADSGGKAGRSQYLIQVGAVDHLYKTSKRRSQSSKRRTRRRSLSCIPCVDLHGMTRTAALGELNANLPHWVETAMQGPYPWVIPVRIVCGGGNQILSEAVAHWIRERKQVSKAPKEHVL